MTKKIPLLPKIVLLYCLLGVIVSAGVSLAPKPQPIARTVAVPRAKKEKRIPLIYGEPVRMQVPSVGIDLTIRDGNYNKATKSWLLVSNDAYYALTSHLPNNKYGNTVIYGHNNKDVLGNTKNLELYDELIITTKNGHKFTYVYMEHDVANPKNTEVFTTDTPGPRVTLLTCSGTWNQERRLMVFEYSGVK